MKNKIIGLTEFVEVMGVEVPARIDTGASRCSIDKGFLSKLGKFKSIKTKKVVSSHGESVREVVKLPLIIAGRKFNATFSVADRQKLSHEVLIGRYILKKGFLINAQNEARSY